MLLPWKSFFWQTPPLLSYACAIFCSTTMADLDETGTLSPGEAEAERIDKKIEEKLRANLKIVHLVSFISRNLCARADSRAGDRRYVGQLRLVVCHYCRLAGLCKEDDVGAAQDE